MQQEPHFYIQQETKLVVEVIPTSPDMPSSICNSLKELIPNTSEGASEKHLPVVEAEGNRVTVKVGSIYHPMTEEHSIAWVYLQTEKGCQRYNFSPAEEPVATFQLTDGDAPVAAYAYCNLHGFWKTSF